MPLERWTVDELVDQGHLRYQLKTTQQRSLPMVSGKRRINRLLLLVKPMSC